MQPVSQSSRSFKGETQPVVPIAAPTKLLVLHGSEIAPVAIEYLNKIIKATSLSHQTLSVDDHCPGITARDAVNRLARNGDAGSHLLLSAQGWTPSMPKGLERKGKHAVSISAVEATSISTKYVLDRIAFTLAGSQVRRMNAGGSRPFIHIESCGAGVLRKELIPGSAFWRSVNVLVYSSKRYTSLGICGNSISTAIRYIDWCEKNDLDVDPLKLFYLTGLRRGGCLTLMGGDLSAPLFWHAPKSEADLSDRRSLAMLQGDPTDIANLNAQVGTLTQAELDLLPAASRRELMSNRLVSDDLNALQNLLDRYPELCDTPTNLGEPPLIEAASSHADQCLTLLLERGASPNATATDGRVSALEACIDSENLYGLSQLLAWKADPDLMSLDGLTPLRLAIENNWIEGIRCLLDHGARMDLRLDGMTCLEAAVSDGHAEAVQCLLYAGAGEAEGLSSALVESAEAAGHEDIADMLGNALLKGALSRVIGGKDQL